MTSRRSSPGNQRKRGTGVESASDSGVTLVSAVRLRAGSEDRYRHLHHVAASAARDSGNLVRAELVPAPSGSDQDTVSLLTFATRADLDRWVASPERRKVLDHMALLHDGGRSINVLAGFPAWYGGSAKPERWRQAIVISVGLVPTSLATTSARTLLLPHAGLVVSVCFVSLANVVVLTWLVLPRLNRLFRRLLND